MAIDKANWHAGGAFPKDVHSDQSYLHIGFYLGWLIYRDLISENFKRKFSVEIDAYRSSKLNHIGLCKLLDGVLTNEELNQREKTSPISIMTSTMRMTMSTF